MKTRTLLVLVNGIGSKFKGNYHMETLGPDGEMFLDYSLFDAAEAGFNKFVFVYDREYGHELRKHVFSKVSDSIEVEFVVRDGNDLPVLPVQGLEYLCSWGSAHDIWRTRHQINEPFTVISSQYYYGRQVFDKALSFMSDYPQEFGVLTHPLANTLSDYGKVNRQLCLVEFESETISEIVEFRDIRKDSHGYIRSHAPKGLNGVLSGQIPASLGIYCLNPFVFECLEAGLTRFILDYQAEDAPELTALQLLENCRRNGWKSLRLIESNSQFLSISNNADRITARRVLQELKYKGFYPDVLEEMSPWYQNLNPVYEGTFFAFQ